jgi:hypothetical protein
MKVLRQLLREFWLPLTLGVAWTIFNVFDKPLSQWTLRHTLNIFGPTFFFFSWLVAQWYRVRKQQHVEEELTDIRAGVRALQEPFLPCALFMTLRIDAPPDDVRRVFGAEPGYRAYGPDRPMPPPPHGLPPGMRDGRLFSSHKYLDYRDGVLESAGVFRQSHPGYNTIHRPVSHTVAQLASDTLAEISERSEPLLSQPGVQVELYLGGTPSSSTTKPTLVLASGMPDAKIATAWALDDAVFVDVLSPMSPTNATGSSISITALNGAFMRVTLDFVYVRGMSELPRASWPTLHNLQLWFRGAGQLLTFKPDQLQSQITKENPRPIARGDATCAQIVFEYSLDPTSFANGLLAIS